MITTLYALHHGQPAWIVGVILSVYAAVPALISIHVGKWIDRIGVKIPVFIACLFVSVACAVPIFFPYETFGIKPIYVTCLLAGTGFVFALISGQGLIGHLTTNKTRATGFTFQSMAFSASGAAGPVIAGYLIDEKNYYWAYGGALAFALAAALVFLLISRGLPSSLSANKQKKVEKHSLFELFKHPLIRNVLLASALVSMAWDLQAFMIPVYGTEIGLDAVAIGWLLSVFSVCSFAVRALMPILSHHFKEWSIIIFVLCLHRRLLPDISLHNQFGGPLYPLRMAWRLFGRVSAQRPFSASSGHTGGENRRSDRHTNHADERKSHRSAASFWFRGLCYRCRCRFLVTRRNDDPRRVRNSEIQQKYCSGLLHAG